MLYLGAFTGDPRRRPGEDTARHRNGYRLCMSPRCVLRCESRSEPSRSAVARVLCYSARFVVAAARVSGFAGIVDSAVIFMFPATSLSLFLSLSAHRNSGRHRGDPREISAVNPVIVTKVQSFCRKVLIRDIFRRNIENRRLNV